MSLFERDSRKHLDSHRDARGPHGSAVQRETSSGSGSNSDAEISAAHIADLVRRTSERLSAPSPSAVAYPHGASAPQSANVEVLDPAPAPPHLSQLSPPSSPPPTTARPVLGKPGQAGRLRSPLALALAAGGVVVAVAIIGALAMGRPDAPGEGATPQTSTRSAPAGYTVKVTDVITDCATHAYGMTKRSFETGNCVRATRAVATGQVSGHPAIFVVSQIQMGSVEAAASVKQVLDATGTGNLNDLLREGRSFPGAPERMPSAGYASVQTGTTVQVAEAGFLEGRSSSSSNPALRAAAAQVASMETPHS